MTLHMSFALATRRLWLVFALGSILAFALASSALAEPQPECGNDPNDPLGLDCGKLTGLTQNDPRAIVGRIINVVLGVLGTIATVLIFYAGFLWMTAGGEEEQVTKAKTVLYSSIIGLVIILSAYAISTFVVRQIYSATSGVNYGSGPVTPP